MAMKRTEFAYLPEDEDGLTPSCVVDLAHALRHTNLTLERTPAGFIARYEGYQTRPYGLLFELLEDIADGTDRRHR